MDGLNFSLILVVFIGSFIPLVEYLLAVPVGIILMDQPAVPVVVVSIVGNSLGVILIVLLGAKIRSWMIHRRQKQGLPEKENKRQERTKRYLEKYGMPGVGIIGSFLLSSHLSAATAVALGVSKGYAIFWTVIGVIIWSVAFGVISVYASHWFEPFLGEVD